MISYASLEMELAMIGNPLFALLALESEKANRSYFYFDANIQNPIRGKEACLMKAGSVSDLYAYLIAALSSARGKPCFEISEL